MFDAEKIALLPAAGPQTLAYIRRHFGNLPTLPLEFEKLNAHLPFEYAPISEHLKRAFSAAGYQTAEHILVPNITLLKLMPKLDLGCSKCLNYPTSPLLNKKIFLLGSKYTIANSSFFPQSTHLPLSVDQIEKLEELRHTFYAGRDSQLTQTVYSSLDFEEADYVVIACSELSVAFEKYTFEGKKYDLLAKIAPPPQNLLENQE